MAKAGYATYTGAPVALAAATTKTILTVLAPAQFGVDLRKWRVAFDGVTASAVPGVVELFAFTTDGTGTAGTVNQAYGRAVTAGFTSKYNYTVEPSTLVIVERLRVSPNGGVVVYDYPYGEGPDTFPSNGMGIRCTFAATVNVDATMWFERC